MNLEINSNLILERHRLKLTRYKISYLDEFSVEKRENTGAFHSMKDSGLSFRKFPVTNGKKFFVKEDNILPGIPILFFFLQISHHATVSGLSGDFPGKFPYHFFQFRNLESWKFRKVWSIGKCPTTTQFSNFANELVNRKNLLHFF